ncbi:MAG: hypothetical protein ACTSQK_02980, partial [Candidatus Heimdallarchaeota archaeon]
HHAVFEPGDEDAAIATHTAIAAAHQNAPGLIATHTAIATAHQNAPGLISTHASDDNAHHEVFEPGDEDAAISTHTSDDDAHHAIYLDADAVQAVEDAGVVLSASKGIHLNGNPPDDTYTGIILDIDTSGCNVGQPVYIDGSNSVAPAKADSISTMPCIGICVAAGKVLTHGVFRDDSGLILTAAGKVYVNDAVSAILTTPPSGVGDVVQIVGIAINTDEIFVSPRWKEITIDDLDLIGKAVNISNSQFACFQSFNRTDTIDNIRHQLKTKNYEYRGFLYDDGTFTVYLDFRKRPEYTNWEVMRCWIQWDLLNASINPLDALQITGNKTREFIEEVKTNVYMRPLNYETAPAVMKQWFNPQIETIYYDLGIKITYEKDGDMVNLLFELV